MFMHSKEQSKMENVLVVLLSGGLIPPFLLFPTILA
jgi:hypothetical protein